MAKATASMDRNETLTEAATMAWKLAKEAREDVLEIMESLYVRQYFRYPGWLLNCDLPLLSLFQVTSVFYPISGIES